MTPSPPTMMDRMKPLLALFLMTCAPSLVAQETPQRHLFILAGQSNMTRNVINGFTAKVEQAFGKEHIGIASYCKPGRAIRYWCVDWQYRDSRKLSEQEIAQNGSLYPPMLAAIKDAMGEQSFDTITFIWMQGESDAIKGWADVYAESFLKLLDRLKKDLNHEHMRFVIGRLSDHDMRNEKAPHWTMMREAQIKLAETHKNGAWVDTDDLNDIAQAKPGTDTLHYGPVESTQLGERFAVKAIDMLTNKKSSP